MRTAAAALALLLLQATLPVAADQHAAPPSPQENVLWAHPDPVEHRNHHRMDTQEDADSQGAPGTAHEGTSWRWTITLQPGLNETVVLDANATILVETHIGGPGAGAVSISTALHHGDELIAEGAARDHTFTPDKLPIVEEDLEEEYPLLQWDLDVVHDRLEPGQDLVWSVVATGQFTGIFMGMGEETGRSRIVLPIAQVVPQVDEEPEEELVTPGPAGILLLVPLALLVHRLRRTPHQDDSRT